MFHYLNKLTVCDVVNVFLKLKIYTTLKLSNNFEHLPTKNTKN